MNKTFQTDFPIGSFKKKGLKSIILPNIIWYNINICFVSDGPVCFTHNNVLFFHFANKPQGPSFFQILAKWAECLKAHVKEQHSYIVSANGGKDRYLLKLH